MASTNRGATQAASSLLSTRLPSSLLPLDRLTTKAAVYLASPGAAYTTGITIFVDGGIMLP